MSDYKIYCIGFVFVILGFIASGVWLIVTGHYGWAWIPWLMLCGLQWRAPASSHAASNHPQPVRTWGPDDKNGGGGTE